MVWDGIEIANSLDVVASIERHSLQGANMFPALVDRAKLAGSPGSAGHGVEVESLGSGPNQEERDLVVRSPLRS